VPTPRNGSLELVGGFAKEIEGSLRLGPPPELDHIRESSRSGGDDLVDVGEGCMRTRMRPFSERASKDMSILPRASNAAGSAKSNFCALAGSSISRSIMEEVPVLREQSWFFGIRESKLSNEDGVVTADGLETGKERDRFVGTERRVGKAQSRTYLPDI
jgi:hypothetical protein